MADGLLAAGELGSEAMGPGPERTGWAAEEKGVFQDEDLCGDRGDRDKPGTSLPSYVLEGRTNFPEIFQTRHLLFYERFRAYQDYILADCKASEVREFTAEFLEKVLEPSGWQAVWHTNVFEVLVEVTDVDFAALKAVVRLARPHLCESRVSTVTVECVSELLELKGHQLPLQELWVVFDDSGAFDQTALAIEHVRFFYQNIWRSWDEEEEDEDDYFVRCVEPRLRLHYDILEDRVPSGLVVDYHSLLSQCEESYRKFSNLRSSLSSCRADTEQENISMVEGLKLYSEIEQLKQKLKLIENPLLRYVFGYQKNSNIQAKGVRANGQKVTHVVSPAMMTGLLQSLLRDRLCQEPCEEETEIQFHSDPLSAVNACFEGDTVIVCPGRYMVPGAFSIADSIELEGDGLPDDLRQSRGGDAGAGERLQMQTGLRGGNDSEECALIENLAFPRKLLVEVMKDLTMHLYEGVRLFLLAVITGAFCMVDMTTAAAPSQ
ncbi:SHC SH2 domain-binding protein 1 [Pteropus vampyrus]|uniref:SHC SH2 domain-binding protein 1 n=1 Tax=Pteropus vampyrus TaxID=132908 RepID=A0A6P3R690_PTEVA|nr:SHC SH2 domain-binding protein 1 [Pteropus vampyrus]